jgi:aryl-alcohol dehydrogenase-like predicted oxidoreductase
MRSLVVTRPRTGDRVPGTLSIDHVRENLAAVELELADEEFEALR